MSTDRAGRRIGVLFNDVDEFLQELALDAQQSKIERGIVRVTQMFNGVPTGTHQRVFLVAGYCEADTGRPVQLEQFLGEDWGEGFPGRVDLVDRTRTVKDAIEAACVGHQLQIRGGALRELHASRA